MILRITVSGKSDLPSRSHKLASSLGLPDLEIRRAYFFELNHGFDKSQLEALEQRLADPILEVATQDIEQESRHQVWVAYQRGIVDNECDSLVRLCRIFGIDATAAKVATVYLSTGSHLLRVISERHFNPNIEEIHTEEPRYETLLPLGQYTPIETYDPQGLSDQELVRLGSAGGRNLDLPKMKQIQRIQAETGAPYVTDVLLEALDARWSDHCYHTTWKSLGGLLGRLVDASKATHNPNIVSMFADNAGVWDFYDGWALAIKAETHNGPSAISAYFGQLTKLGGVLRDILGVGLGGDPVGSFEYSATGIPGMPPAVEGRPAPRQIAEETIRAIKEYGNTFGVPMMWSHMCFHPAYGAKPFALGGTIGLIPTALAQKGEPQPGDLLILIGGLTGNDGIHGASASSAGATMDQAAVQIGSPLEEVKFNTAILDLRDSGCLRALTDVGGAGLNSAVGEIGDPCGVWLNTALVPLKTAGLPMWRILLSESQERMILAVKPEKLGVARAILLRHEVRNTVIGKFTGLGRYTVLYDAALTEQDAEAAPAGAMLMTGEIGLDVPYALLGYVPQGVSTLAPKLVAKRTEWPAIAPADLVELMPKLLGDIEVSDQSYADSQYDSSVQGRHTYGPYSGTRRPVRTSYWAAKMLHGKPYSAVFATAFHPWLFEANPRLALRQCFFEVIAKMVLAGVNPRDIALCDNFYTPHLSDGWAYWLVSMVDELASLVRAFGTPVISGKDSSAGSVRTRDGMLHVPPAVFLSGLGKHASFETLLRGDWQQPGNLLVQIGPPCRSAAGTAAARILKLEANDADDLHVPEYLNYVAALAAASRTGWTGGTPVGPGGLLGLMAARSISSGFGVELVQPPEGLWWLLAEHRCGALIEVDRQNAKRLPAELQPRVIGSVVETGPSIRLDGLELLTAAAIQSWAGALEESLA